MADDALARVIKDFEGAKKANRQFHEACEKRYASYRGILDQKSEAAAWTSKLHPPYVNQVVEAITAGLLDPIRFKVKPRPKMGSSDEVEQSKAAATTIERLLTYELDLDKFDQKYPVFIKQGLITGLTVGKTYWKQKHAKKYSLQRNYYPVHDDTGAQVGHFPQLDEVPHEELVVDDPCFSPVDVRDFFWPESAISVDDADFLIHRSWVTMQQAEQMQDVGVWKNVSKLSDTRDSEGNSDREQVLFATDRTSDRIEILEYWTDDRVIVVGNRNVLLRDYENPFWHGEKPFVVASALPDLFQLPGMSVVELCSHLQDMLWTLQNQRLDALRLLANAVTLIRTDVEDAEGFEWYPGAQWWVESVEQVKQLPIDPTSAQITLEAESLLKGDIQNISGGGPFMSGANSQQIDQKTATGVSIVSNLAQRMIEARKQNIQNALKGVGIHFVEMMQQFMRDERAISIVGQGGELEFLQVGPEDIQGRFDITIEVSNESLMRQERRAEAQAKMQVAAESAATMAAVGTPLNLKAFMEDYLDAFDVTDKERYFSAQPQAAPPTPGEVENPENQGPNQGVTAPQSTNPANSPSTRVSMSPEVFQHRANTFSGRNH